MPLLRLKLQFISPKERCSKVNRCSSFVQCALCCPSLVPYGAGLVSVVERLSALAERLRAVPLGLELQHLAEELRCLRCRVWENVTVGRTF